MNLLYANDRRGQYPDSWYAASATPLDPFPALKGAKKADVCVIGGGYTGLSTALHLAERGYDVTLLEAHRVGWGASGRNGGQIGTGLRKGPDELARTQGPDDARLLWQITEDAKALVKSLVDRHQIACDWKPGVAYVELDPREVGPSHAHAAELARDYGYDRIEPLDRDATRALLGTDIYHGGILDRGAAHMHPLNFALGLARAAAAAGVRIHERTEVTRIDGTTAITGHGKVAADHLVLACNGYLGGLEPNVAARVMPINSYVLATEPLGQERAETLITQDVAVADSKFVVNYWRRSADHRLIWGGAESYGYRFPRDIAPKVRRTMLQVYPQLADVKVSHAWGGTLAITVNRLPCFYRPAPGVLSASGYSGHGVAMSTMAGLICAEAIAGQAERFDVMERLPKHRFPGGRALRWPSLVAAMSWFALRDRLGF